MPKAKIALAGVLLVGLMIGITGGLPRVASGTEASFSNLLSMIEPAVVQVWVDESITETEVASGNVTPIFKGYDWLGSGFSVGGGDVVTDWHVVEEATTKAVIRVCGDSARKQVNCSAAGVAFIREIKFLGPIGVSQTLETLPTSATQLYVATVKKANVLHDLALLSTKLPKPITRVWFGDSDAVKVGDGGFAIGYPSPNGELTVTELQISNKRQQPNTVPIITVDGKQYQLIPWVLVKHKVGMTWHLAVASAPSSSFSTIEVNVSLSRDPKTNKPALTPCEVKVAAKSVQCGFATEMRDFLQTDDAVDHGNSGGPIFNWNGQVIGIVDLGAKDPSWEYHTTSNKAREILGLSK